MRTSNAGHALTTGIAEADHARRIADGLLRPAFYSGWGVRTLAAGEVRYNPMSYHNGSVWPHDNSLIAHGLARYAFKNGARVKERSDAVFSPEGIKSTPGQWPGWTLPVCKPGRG